MTRTLTPPRASADAAASGVEAVRAEFPILAREVNGQPLAYLDNAASTQKPRRVLEAMRAFHEEGYANVHRGLHTLSTEATDAYDAARARMAAFLGAGRAEEVVWTRGATEGVNLVALAWGTTHVRAGDEIVVSALEHHANLVPWQMLAARIGASLRFVELTGDGSLDLESLDRALTARTRLVAVAHVSNVLGTVVPVRTVCEAARSVGAVVLVDGAQAVPHLPVDVAEIGCDFYVASGHKMYGPMGIGVLWGRAERLEEMPPLFGGGDMIDRVERERSTYAAPPLRFEAGTPNVTGAIGIAAAADFIDDVGHAWLGAHERDLLAHARAGLSGIDGVRVLGPAAAGATVGAVSFVARGAHPHDLATILDAHGIAVRAGHHCAHPLMCTLGVGATARASFAAYNTRDEVDRLVAGVRTSLELLGGGG